MKNGPIFGEQIKPKSDAAHHMGLRDPIDERQDGQMRHIEGV